MTVVNKFNVNKQQVTLDADIIENMSANDVSYDDSFQYDENTVGNKLSELESIICNSCVDSHGKLVSLSEIETTTGVYIKIDGSVLTDAAVGTTPFIPVLGLKKIYYTGKNSAPNIVASAAFYNKDYKLLSIVKGETSNQVYNFPINIPDGAYYVRCCSYKTSEFNIKANVGAFANVVKMLEEIYTSETNKNLERYVKLSTYYGDCSKRRIAINIKGDEVTATKEWACSDFILITDIADFETKGITLVKPMSMYVNDGPYYPYVIFYDTDYNVIDFIGEKETQINDGKVTISEIPSGAVYIRMNGRGGEISYVERYSLTSRIEKLYEENERYSTVLCDCVETSKGNIVPLSEISVSSGTYLNLKGVLLTGAAVGTTPFIPVLGLKKIYYTGKNSAPNIVALGCFYDENYNLLSVIPSEFTTLIKNFEIEVPNGAYYARFSTYKTSEFNIKADVGAFANILKIMHSKDQEPINKDGLEDYFSISMFQKFAIIGDSYASGEISTPNKYGDFYDLSWGQIMARRNGNICINMSAGGLTTKTWLENTKGLTLLHSSEAQQLYILALGLNDANKTELGTQEDMKSDSSQNPDTFYGNYAKIIDAIKTKAPNAKIVMVTTFRNTGNFVNINTAIQEIAEYFGLPCIITRDDTMMSSEFYLQNLVSSHPTAPLYSAMAVGYEKLLSKCMYENLAYFQDYIG